MKPCENKDCYFHSTNNHYPAHDGNCCVRWSSLELKRECCKIYQRLYPKKTLEKTDFSGLRQYIEVMQNKINEIIDYIKEHENE